MAALELTTYMAVRRAEDGSEFLDTVCVGSTPSAVLTAVELDAARFPETAARWPLVRVAYVRIEEVGDE
jgi:hypothetical protein